MAGVQTIWRKSYEQIVDYAVTHRELAVGLGFEGRTISQGQYRERREALGVLPLQRAQSWQEKTGNLGLLGSVAAPGDLS